MHRMLMDFDSFDKMLKIKQILVQIRLGDWFSVDLKDAYFHIQRAPRHRPFLRFAKVRVIQGSGLSIHSSALMPVFSNSHVPEISGDS